MSACLCGRAGSKTVKMKTSRRAFWCIFWQKNVTFMLNIKWINRLCVHEKLRWNIIFLPQLNLALHPSRVAKSSTSFGWDKGRKVTAAGWQVTLCDPIWHVISRSSELISTNCYIYPIYLLTIFNGSLWSEGSIESVDAVLVRCMKTRAALHLCEVI